MIQEDPLTRVLDLTDVILLRKKAKATGKRFILTNGCFDLLHRGHLSYLYQTSVLGDILVVAVNSDASVQALKGPDRPLNPEQDRAFALASLRFVDAVFVFPGPRLAGEIRQLKPDLYTKAGDYTLDSLEPTEKAALLEVGTSIHFIPFHEGHSTTSLIQRMRDGS